MNPFEKLKSYVEGGTTLATFYQDVLKGEELQSFLQEATSVPPYTKDGDLFLYSMNLDVGEPASDLNLKDALSKRLNQLGVDHKIDTSAAKGYELFLSISPLWLSLPEFYIRNLKKELESSKIPKERKAAAKTSIEKDFRYLKKPPRWVQSPTWLFAGERPLIFVGQLDLSHLMHDTGQLYVFYDQANDSYQTVSQVA